MNAEECKALLEIIDACKDARQWAKGKTLHEVWTTCERGDWLLWLAGRMEGQPGWHTRQQIVLAACDCAETALQYVPVDENRPRLAMETARAWTRGEATLEQVRAAAYAAYAAAYAGAAAYAARISAQRNMADMVRRALPQPCAENAIREQDKGCVR